MGQDEVGTLRTLTAYRAIIDPLIASYRGRIFNTAGGSLVADFASAVDAVQCAVDVQETIAKANLDRPTDEQMRFRIGVHVGDIMVQSDNLFGDAVNIAARSTALGEQCGICVTGTCGIRSGQNCRCPCYLGEQQVKNIAQPIKAYRIRNEISPTLPDLSVYVCGSFLLSQSSRSSNAANNSFTLRAASFRGWKSFRGILPKRPA